MKILDNDLCDMKGVPIRRGDLLKTPHFRTKSRRYWLYHTVAFDEVWEVLVMVPTCHLEPSKVCGGGKCLLTPALAAVAEIICGHDADGTHYTDRKRRK